MDKYCRGRFQKHYYWIAEEDWAVIFVDNEHETQEQEKKSTPK